MKRNERVEINGKQFTIMVNKPCKAVAEITRWNYRSIWKAYDNPSSTKVEIWESWKDWFERLDDSDCWIESRNCMEFTIGGWLVHEGKTYNVYITKCCQKLYPVI